jgi:hypothetical protein
MFTVPEVRTRPERLHTAMPFAGVGGFLDFDFGAPLGHAGRGGWRDRRVARSGPVSEAGACEPTARLADQVT